MKNMNCVSTMPEIMPEITDEAIIEALFAQRPYEEKVINSAFLEIPAEYQRKLNIPNVEKMPPEVSSAMKMWRYSPSSQRSQWRHIRSS
jgi:hypothetical protein